MSKLKASLPEFPLLSLWLQEPPPLSQRPLGNIQTFCQSENKREYTPHDHKNSQKGITIWGMKSDSVCGLAENLSNQH